MISNSQLAASQELKGKWCGALRGVNKGINSQSEDSSANTSTQYKLPVVILSFAFG